MILATEAAKLRQNQEPNAKRGTNRHHTGILMEAMQQQEPMAPTTSAVILASNSLQFGATRPQAPDGSNANPFAQICYKIKS